MVVLIQEAIQTTNNMTIGWVGKKGSGKSYLMIKFLMKNLAYNKKMHEKYELDIRRCALNFPVAQSVLDEYRDYLVGWKDIEELPHLHNCDVYCDDISSKFDQHGWRNVPMDVRSWLRLNEHRPFFCNFYFNAQNFAEVDVSFRRMTDQLYVVTKGMGSKRPMPSEPPPKRIWGFIYAEDVPDEEYRKESFNQSLYSGGKWHWLSRKICALYDTGVELDRPVLPKLEHSERECAKCGFVKVTHA